MIVYNCNKYELPLFNTRLLLDCCGSFLGGEIYRVAKGGKWARYGNAVLIKCFLGGWFIF